MCGCQRCGTIQAKTSATTNCRTIWVHSCSPAPAIKNIFPNVPPCWTTSALKCTARRNTDLVGYSALHEELRPSKRSALEGLGNSTERRIISYLITSSALSNFNLQTDCKTAGGLMLIYRLLQTDRSWPCAELVITVTESQPSKLPRARVCVRACTQGEHERRTASATSQRCKTHKSCSSAA